LHGKGEFKMKELKRNVKNVTLVYSIQSQILMNKFKDFNIEEFEKNFANGVLIGDKIISKYILEKEVSKLNQEKKNGS